MGVSKKKRSLWFLAPKTHLNGLKMAPSRFFNLMGVIEVTFCSKTTPPSRNKHRKIRKLLCSSMSFKMKTSVNFWDPVIGSQLPLISQLHPDYLLQLECCGKPDHHPKS